MIILSFKFPAHRYHASPWDAHVNEGRIEWPPSPWRLLRALLAVGYAKWNWGTEPPQVVRSLITKLSEAEPSYKLPRATPAHTRHYMPTRDKPTKVFDAFVRLSTPDEQLLVKYDISLSTEEVEWLDQLLSSLTYLGRAESWVEVELLSSAEHTRVIETDQWCEPHSYGQGRPTRLIAPMSSNEFDQWRSESVERAFAAAKSVEEEKLQAKGKQLTKANLKKLQEKTESRFPDSVLNALQVDTNDWQSQGWPQPPGSRWLDYCVPDQLLEIPPLRTAPRTDKASAAQAVLLSIDGVGKRGTVRPLFKRMLPVMELFHSLAVYKATKQLPFGNIPELTGKADDGSILRGHRHAHLLPLSLLRSRGSPKKVDHVFVWTPDPSGLSPRAIEALTAIRWAYAKGISDLSVNCVGIGTVSSLRRQLEQNPEIRPEELNVMTSGRFWHSITPFVFTKYLHKHGKKTPENQIREELQKRGFDDPIAIRFLTSTQMVERKLKGFVIRRQSGKNQPPLPTSWAMELDFAKPQQGPICLGYASHFGLGLFRAVE